MNASDRRLRPLALLALLAGAACGGGAEGGEATDAPPEGFAAFSLCQRACAKITACAGDLCAAYADPTECIANLSCSESDRVQCLDTLAGEEGARHAAMLTCYLSSGCDGLVDCASEHG